MIDALIVIPPIVKYSAGPFLGPALLKGVACENSLNVEVLDLNIEFIHSTGVLPSPGIPKTPFIGDHCKPGTALDVAEAIYIKKLWKTFSLSLSIDKRPILEMRFSHDEVSQIVSILANTDLGNFIYSALKRFNHPKVVGISITWSGQVFAGLLVSAIARRIWPNIKVVLGGAHASALSDRIAHDSGFGNFIDGVLPFHCELSFVELLKNTKNGEFSAAGLIIPGMGFSNGDITVKYGDFLPKFSDLHLYGRPRLILPFELSRGCPYGLCSFCTYSSIERGYIEKDLALLSPILDIASEAKAALSFKDCLLTPHRLEAVSEIINGRVEWSACTKLDQSYSKSFMKMLAVGGCRTLEVGLETLDPELQEILNKHQSLDLLDLFLESAACSGISVVVNYMTGLPGEDVKKGQDQLDWLRDYLNNKKNLQVLIEHNEFQLSRISQMGRTPDSYGISTILEWPWSSILSWKEEKY